MTTGQGVAIAGIWVGLGIAFVGEAILRGWAGILVIVFVLLPAALLATTVCAYPDEAKPRPRLFQSAPEDDLTMDRG